MQEISAIDAQSGRTVPPTDESERSLSALGPTSDSFETVALRGRATVDKLQYAALLINLQEPEAEPCFFNLGDLVKLVRRDIQYAAVMHARARSDGRFTIDMTAAVSPLQDPSPGSLPLSPASLPLSSPSSLVSDAGRTPDRAPSPLRDGL